MELEGKVALITGSGKGLGKEIALAFAKEGAELSINYFGSRRDMAELAESLGGRKVMFIEADITKAEGVRYVIDETVKAFGRIDILVNNAGQISYPARFEEVTEDEWDKYYSLQLKAAYFASVYAGRIMRMQGYGKIITTSAAFALRPEKTAPHTAAVRAAISDLTQNLAAWGSPEIRANAVAVGFYAKMGQNGDYVEKIPPDMIFRPEEITKIYVFLASGASDRITGQTFTVTGGYTL